MLFLEAERQIWITTFLRQLKLLRLARLRQCRSISIPTLLPSCLHFLNVIQEQVSLVQLAIEGRFQNIALYWEVMVLAFLLVRRQVTILPLISLLRLV